MIPVSNITVEKTVGNYTAYVFGRGQSNNVNNTPSQLAINSSSAYGLETAMDLTFPITTALSIYTMQIFALNNRYYGWGCNDFCVVADANNYIYLSSVLKGPTPLGGAVVVNVANITCLLFSCPGTLTVVNNSSGIFSLFTKTGTQTTYLYPLNMVNNQFYPIAPQSFNLTKSNLYYEYLSLVAMIPQSSTPGVLSPEFCIYQYDDLMNTPAYFAAQEGKLGNPYQDPQDPSLIVLFNNPTGGVTTSNGISNINVKLRSYTYPVKIPFYFWFILGAAIVAIIILIIVLIVIRSKKIKYKKPVPARHALQHRAPHRTVRRTPYPSY